MKAVWEEFAEETTCHGWKYVANKSSSTYSRLLWAVVVFSLIGGLVYTLVTSYIAYTKHKILTVTRTEKRNQLNFPAVTICNKGTYDNSSGQISQAEANFFLRYSELYNPATFNFNISEPILNSSIAAFQAKSSFDWSAIIHWVNFHYQFLNHTGTERFEFQESGSLGRCMVIHGPKYFKKFGDPVVQSVGRKSGLQLLLSTLQDGYIVNNQGDAGFEVFIHESHTPAPLNSGGGIPVSPGFNTHIAMKPVEYKFLPKPYRSYGDVFCEETSPGYSHTACVDECIQNMTVDTCGCKTMLEYDTHPSVKNCTFKETYDCYLQIIIANYIAAEAGDICNCPRPCRFIKYEIQTSQSSYPSKATHQYLRDVLNVNTTLDDLRYAG
ncbi:acid-sensing ion channel 1C [Patella vulgata]|uniref:acid-sensing ion channel 1C n=1 Tax=Patella vulgata TaxID=6465 RepID=UPI00217F7DB3|nr:acid-sensing ion channel 1C [Patella vulgata]